MCTLAFQGYGYSPKFIENYREIVNQIDGNSNIQIEVVNNLDSICNACPNKTKQNKCNKQAKVSQLDSRHMEVLGIKIGDTVIWSEMTKKIKEEMSLEKFEYACSGCEWKPYGICKKMIT